MGLAAEVLWLTTIGWGLPFTSLLKDMGPVFRLCSPVKKMDTIFTLLNMRVRN